MGYIKIKPHHLLDVLKLHGKGIEKFVPAPDFGHDFYRVANEIVNGEVSKFVFTRDCDDICGPCKYSKDGKCSDFIAFLDHYSKDTFNKEIDDRLFALFGWQQEKEYGFEDIFQQLMKELDYSLFGQAWKQADEAELRFRTAYTIMGAYKVLEKIKSSDCN